MNRWGRLPLAVNTLPTARVGPFLLDLSFRRVPEASPTPSSSFSPLRGLPPSCVAPCAHAWETESELPVIWRKPARPGRLGLPSLCSSESCRQQVPWPGGLRLPEGGGCSPARSRRRELVLCASGRCCFINTEAVPKLDHGWACRLFKAPCNLRPSANWATRGTDLARSG